MKTKYYAETHFLKDSSYKLRFIQDWLKDVNRFRIHGGNISFDKIQTSDTIDVSMLPDKFCVLCFLPDGKTGVAAKIVRGEKID